MNYLITHKNVIGRHLAIWALITIYLCIVDPVNGSLMCQIVVTFLIMADYILVFYAVGLYIVPKFYVHKRNFLLLLISFIALFILFVLITYFMFFIVKPFFNAPNPFAMLSSTEILTRSAYAFMYPFIPGVTYAYSLAHERKVKLQNEKEKSILVKEVNFLKNQFNSHITFNFLNFCYGNALQTSPETARAIDIFSSMLRYSLETKSDEKISLEEELEYINNFIHLQKTLSSQVYVNLEVNDINLHKTILPRLLITPIENAFKHGVFNDPINPIKITLDQNADSLELCVKNKKKSNVRKEIKTGVGHENVKQILESFYPNNYKYIIDDDLLFYSSTIILNI